MEGRYDTNGYAGKNLPCDRQYLRTGQSDGFRVGTTARDRHPGVPGQAAWGSGPGRDQGSKPNGQLLFAWFASAWDRFYEVAGDPLNECGAVIMGRRSFEQIDSEQGWVFPDGTAPDWPVIVLQSHARASVKKGKTHFHFVTDGIQSAIAKAQELAGEKYVAFMVPAPSNKP